MLQMAQQAFIALFLDISLSSRLWNTERSSNFDEFSVLEFLWQLVKEQLAADRLLSEAGRC